VTLALLSKLTEELEATKDAWANEAFVGADSQDSERRNATALGGIRVVHKILGIALEDLV
jgi:hypothetical protein